MALPYGSGQDCLLCLRLPGSLDRDGFTTAMYFIVTPAVLGPVAAILFVAAVYLCRRRHLDGGPATTQKKKKGAPGPGVARSPAPSAGGHRQRALGSRAPRGGVEAGKEDDETATMLPFGGQFVASPALRAPGNHGFVSIDQITQTYFAQIYINSDNLCELY